MKHVLKQNLQAGSNQTSTSAEKRIRKNRKKAHRIPLESKPRRGRQPNKAWWSDRRDKRRTADFLPPSLFQGATRWQSLFASEEEANGVGTSTKCEYAERCPRFVVCESSPIAHALDTNNLKTCMCSLHERTEQT